VVRTQPNTRVVVLSVFSWGAIRQTLLAAGATACFDKAMEFRKARECILELAEARARAQDAAPGGFGPATTTPKATPPQTR
jgi:DNA-binding NarL/FixJ family response regulator